MKVGLFTISVIIVIVVLLCIYFGKRKEGYCGGCQGGNPGSGRDYGIGGYGDKMVKSFNMRPYVPKMAYQALGDGPVSEKKAWIKSMLVYYLNQALTFGPYKGIQYQEVLYSKLDPIVDCICATGVPDCEISSVMMQCGFGQLLKQAGNLAAYLQEYGFAGKDEGDLFYHCKGQGC